MSAPSSTSTMWGRRTRSNLSPPFQGLQWSHACRGEWRTGVRTYIANGQRLWRAHLEIEKSGVLGTSDFSFACGITVRRLNSHNNEMCRITTIHQVSQCGNHGFMALERGASKPCSDTKKYGI